MKRLFVLAVVLAATIAAGHKDFLGCPYPSGDVYQTKIDTASPDPNSANYIAATCSAPNGCTGFQTWTNQFTINVANKATPMVPIAQAVPWHQVTSPMPWQSDFIIQPPGTDQHAFVLDRSTCHYYESYQTTVAAPGLTVYSNLSIDLTQPFVQPAVGGNSTASGIPMGLLAIRPEEIKRGFINHAIEWDGVAGSLSQTASVSPAGVKDATDGHQFLGVGTPLPYGSHARLKASFNISGLSPTVQIIARAMQRYGLYVVDSGCCNVIIIAADKRGSIPWAPADAASLAEITPADFEIVAPPQ